MVTYKLLNNPYGEQKSVMRSDNWCIPFDPANTDYTNFKKDVLEGAELQDADGTVMTSEAAQEFIKELP